MTVRSRVALAASALVLAGSLTACGGGGGDKASDAPASASKDEFCTAYNSLFDAFKDNTSAPSDSETVKAIKDWAAKMKETGTPQDIPDDARRGFEAIIDTVAKIKDDATQDEIKALTGALNSSDQKDTEAFGTWATDLCPLPMPSSPPSGP
ncbi:hypothetical protein [Nocardioides sp. LS1]|uniref:hypothetical protein n=1 Tax=Nocardioides sp. LS1 TaxID=1027620 RepID=UPI000F61DD98|nr:hypothetical protein [Nocardioides sp. LS1]GCD90081.1 hypothetical protein NLS1_20870 [Nocardioides sp. LS1]